MQTIFRMQATRATFLGLPACSWTRESSAGGGADLNSHEFSYGILTDSATRPENRTNRRFPRIGGQRHRLMTNFAPDRRHSPQGVGSRRRGYTKKTGPFGSAVASSGPIIGRRRAVARHRPAPSCRRRKSQHPRGGANDRSWTRKSSAGFAAGLNSCEFSYRRPRAIEVWANAENSP
jgi:hypothetical protein